MCLKLRESDKVFPQPPAQRTAFGDAIFYSGRALELPQHLTGAARSCSSGGFAVAFSAVEIIVWMYVRRLKSLDAHELHAVIFELTKGSKDLELREGPVAQIRPMGVVRRAFGSSW